MSIDNIALGMSGARESSHGDESIGSSKHGASDDVIFGLFVLCALSGVILMMGFFLPGTVGMVVGGELFLTAGVTFFGTFLVLLSVLPE